MFILQDIPVDRPCISLMSFSNLLDASTTSALPVISELMFRTRLKKVSMTSVTRNLEHTRSFSHTVGYQCFENIKHAFELVYVQANRSTTNWPVPERFITTSFIQLILFRSECTDQLLPKIFSLVQKHHHEKELYQLASSCQSTTGVSWEYLHVIDSLDAGEKLLSHFLSAKSESSFPYVGVIYQWRNWDLIMGPSSTFVLLQKHNHGKRRTGSFSFFCWYVTILQLSTLANALNHAPWCKVLPYIWP